MTDKKGLPGIWEDIGSYLKVDVSLGEDQSPDAKYPVILRFLVTNTATDQEYQPEIVYEEVQLKVGIPPNWHVEKAENLICGQSFAYDHPCLYEEIIKIRWAVEGRISPTALLQFRQRPSHIPGNQKLPVKAYFGHLTNMNIHQWLEGTLKNLSAPGPDTTLAEMKAREDSLHSIASKIMNSAQQIQDFMLFVDVAPTTQHRDDIIRHKDLVKEYLSRTAEGIGDLMRILTTQRAEGFTGTRDNTIAELTRRAAEIDKATNDLAQKVGVLKTDVGS